MLGYNQSYPQVSHMLGYNQSYPQVSHMLGNHPVLPTGIAHAGLPPSPTHRYLTCWVTTQSYPQVSHMLGYHPVLPTGLNKPTLTLSTTEVKEGDRVGVMCEAEGEASPMSFSFYKTQGNQENPEKETKTRPPSRTNKEEVYFRINEGEQILHFQCEVTIQTHPSQTSPLSDRKTVSVAESLSVPRIEVSPALNFTEGQNMSVSCSVQTSPSILEEVEIIIQKDSRILESSKNKNTSYSQLATASHSGTYTCKAESKRISKISSVSITVTELFPRPSLHMNIKSSRINEGSVLSLACSVTGLSHEASNNQTFYLVKDNGVKIQMNQGGKYSRKVVEGDTGEYVCEVTISRIRKTSDPVNIKVYAPVSTPVLTHQNQSSSTAALGDSIQLKCESQRGTLPITYVLFRGSVPLGSIERNDKKPAVFKVNVTKPTDAEQYRCQASNGNTAGTRYSNPINITVITPVTNISLLVIPANGEVEEGQELSLVCSVQNGTLPIDIHFYMRKGSDVLLKRFTVNQSRSAEMQVKSFSSQEDGSYYCTATNGARQALSSYSAPVKAVLARWKKGLIGTFVFFIIVAAIGIAVYLYLDKRKKGSEITSDVTRTTNATNSNHEKPAVEIKSEEELLLVPGSVQTENENHVVKSLEETQGANQENHEVEYTEVEVVTPHPHRGEKIPTFHIDGE
ncbi:platelet endothelial cell adhesion molecule-like [Rhinophrynus dorsalis]